MRVVPYQVMGGAPASCTFGETDHTFGVAVVQTKCPPLRQSPEMPDDQDGGRVTYARDLWSSQDEALRLRDRQMEENVRMLCGQHWCIWSPMLGRFVDVTQWMSENERRWRQRPVMNRILPWFILTHARMTENPPVVTFLPGPDAIDAQLAETMDTIFKTLWRDLGMEDIRDRLCAWLIVGGRAYLQTRIDLRLGDVVPRMATADVVVLDPSTGDFAQDPETGEPYTQSMDNVPLDENYEPTAYLDPLQGQLVPVAEPFSEPEGGLVVDVLSAMEVRGEWGPAPWEKKAWHATRTYMPREEIAARYGVQVTDTGMSGTTSDELKRLLFGADTSAPPPRRPRSTAGLAYAQPTRSMRPPTT